MTQQPNAPFLIGPEHTDRACLLIHGFSGTPAEMRSLGDELAAHGVRVYGMQVSGHSKDPEDLLRYGRKQWIASAEAALNQLIHYPHVFIAGLSMGGVLALLLASRYSNRIAGVIALSTPTRFTGGWQINVVPIARYFIKWYRPLQFLNFKDPKVQAEVLAQARLHDPNISIDFSDSQAVAAIKQMVRIPVPAIADLFSLTNCARRHIHEIRVPLLIIHSRRDQTVPSSCAEELYYLAQLAHPKELHWLEQSDHVVTLGTEQTRVNELVQTFIDAIAPIAAETALPADAQMEEADENHHDH